MALGDWLDIKLLQAISKHTSGAIGALVSFIIISRLVGWAIGPGFLRSFLEATDKAILILIFLYFLLSVGYYFYREIRANARDGSFLVA